ncbi:hypothetical protein WP50_34510 [Lactiplantibacillus plantarum]|nr:hypothetical protein WP50_34510 [Lactiplantibacillus plantarum]
MIFIASAAIILPLILLGGLNLSATRGMTISALVVIITGYFFWQISPTVLTASILQAIHKALPRLYDHDFYCKCCNHPATDSSRGTEFIRDPRNDH